MGDASTPQLRKRGQSGSSVGTDEDRIFTMDLCPGDALVLGAVGRGGRIFMELEEDFCGWILSTDHDLEPIDEPFPALTQVEKLSGLRGGHVGSRRSDEESSRCPSRLEMQILKTRQVAEWPVVENPAQASAPAQDLSSAARRKDACIESLERPPRNISSGVRTDLEGPLLRGFCWPWILHRAG